VAGTGDHIKALVRSHAAGDDAAFYAVALQVAAQEARRGHNQIARDLKKAIDESRSQPIVRSVTAIAQPRGDLKDLVTAAFPDASLTDLIAPSNILERIILFLAEQRQRQRLLEHGYTPAHRLLFDGPPGTGKTFTAAVIAHELSLPLLTVRLDALMSKYLGETASKLRTIFDAATEQRAVYLFDEFDALGADRAGNDVGEARRILNSFLVFLEQASPESVVIAATNHRSILDRALFRRFDAVVTYVLPDPNQAIEVMRRRLGKLGRDLDWTSLGEDGAGLSHAELVKAAESAAKQALLAGMAEVDGEDLRRALIARRSVSGG
jgi:SpoVK/Ycf46/Vps4 family AAA+-type ATPase